MGNLYCILSIEESGLTLSYHKKTSPRTNNRYYERF